jgi:phosphate transport system substrate-binding protein
MSNSKKGPPPIVYIGGALALAGLGYFAFSKLSGNNSNPSSPLVPIASNDNVNVPSGSEIKPVFEVPATVTKGNVIKIGGATSMAQINQSLKTSFEKKFPGVQALAIASSSGKGLTDLAAGSIDVAGVSRELTGVETAQGLVSVPITQDKIAIVVGISNNSLAGTGLTSDQVTKIFTGQAKDWSEVGGKPLAIRPILRPANSGTHRSFQEIGLKGQSFGSSGNFKVLERDATTPLLQGLGVDGIGYATFTQVANQSTVRVLEIDGINPQVANYPYRRTLAYVYKGTPNDAVKAFLGFATSSEGQQLINQQSFNK